MIKGQKINKNLRNSIYPKFYILGVNVTGELTEVLETEDILLNYSFSNGDDIFEPIETGLGVSDDLMYVKTDEKAYVFEYPNSDLTWSSEIVGFNDEFNYDGEYVG